MKRKRSCEVISVDGGDGSQSVTPGRRLKARRKIIFGHDEELILIQEDANGRENSKKACSHLKEKCVELETLRADRKDARETKEANMAARRV